MSKDIYNLRFTKKLLSFSYINFQLDLASYGRWLAALYYDVNLMLLQALPTACIKRKLTEFDAWIMQIEQSYIHRSSLLSRTLNEF